MRHYYQSHNACFAYSLLQLGAVTHEAVAEYEKFIRSRRFTWGNILAWTERNAPWCPVAAVRGAPPGGVGPDLTGKGVLCINLYKPRGRKINSRHAVTFERNLILDPADRAGKLRTLPEYAAWRMGNGWRIEVAAVWRAPA